jgi:hypothetical protein
MTKFELAKRRAANVRAVDAALKLERRNRYRPIQPAQPGSVRPVEPDQEGTK